MILMSLENDFFRRMFHMKCIYKYNNLIRFIKKLKIKTTNNIIWYFISFLRVIENKMLSCYFDNLKLWYVIPKNTKLFSWSFTTNFILFMFSFYFCNNFYFSFLYFINIQSIFLFAQILFYVVVVVHCSHILLL